MAIKISGVTIIDDSRNIVSGAAATFTSNVTIGGTLTYEDVTNIDSVGIVTARQDVHIGESIVHIGDTNTKISFPSNDTIRLETASNTITADNNKTTFGRPIRVGDYIAHNGVDSLGVKFFNQGTGNNNTFIGLGAEDNGTSGGNNHKTFQVFRQGSSVNRVFIDNFGNLRARQGFTVAGVSTFAGLVDINAGGQANTFKVEDLTSGRVVLAGTGGELEDSANLTFNGSTLGVTGDASFSGNVSVGGTLTYEDVTNVDSVGIITAGKGVRITEGGLNVTAGVTTFADNVFAQKKLSFGDSDASTTNLATFGAGDDMKIYHSGVNNHINVTGGGMLIPQASRVMVLTNNYSIVNTASSKTLFKALNDNQVELYFNGVKRLETTDQGIEVTGTSDLDNVYISGIATATGLLYANGGIQVEN